MSDRGQDGSDGGTDADRERRERAAAYPWTDERETPDGSEAIPADATDDDPRSDEADDVPRALELVGTAGIYLAVGSLVLTVLGLGAIYAGLHPWGNAATTVGLGGVSVAMVLGAIFHAYVGDVDIFGREIP